MGRAMARSKVSTEQSDGSDLNKRLLAAVDQVSLADDFQGALAALVTEAGRLLACDGTSVMWLNDDEMEVLASHGELAPLSGLSLPVSQVGAARVALDSNRPAVVPDTAEDAHWRCIPGEERVRAWLGVPLLLGGRTIGLLEWTAHEPDRFGDRDVEMAAMLARYAAPILYRTQLLDDTRRRLRELLDPRLAKPAQMQDVGAALQQVTQEALDLTGARHAFTFLKEEEGLRLRCVAAAGPQQQGLRRTILRGDGTFGGLAAARSVLGRTGTGSGAGPADGEVMAALGITDALILPLRAGKEQVGMLGVAEPRGGRSFDQGAIRLMTHLASQASLIVERAYEGRAASDGYDYETVFQASPLGLCVLSVNGDIQACNPALISLLSRADRNLVGRNLSDLMVAGDWRRLAHALEEVVFTGQRQQVDTRIRSAQGEQRHVRLTLAPAPSLAGSSRRGRAASQRPGEMGTTLVAVLEDVTPLKILEQERVEHLRELREKHQQLQDLDQLRTRFVSNVSHELRTPLAVIKLYATLARKGRPEKQTYYLQTIEQETHRLETMVENILDLTRIDRQTLRLHPELLAAEEIIAQVLEVYQETAEKRGIELKNHVQGNLPRLWADKNDLIQMLTNLVDNALKYTPRGGQVWVAAREIGPEKPSSQVGPSQTGSAGQAAQSQELGDRPMLEIAVGDTGVGIPDDEREHVFERFYRGRNNTPECTGTGLGLAIVQELIAQHGGQVVLKSQVSQGSVFVLQFPLAQSIDTSR